MSMFNDDVPSPLPVRKKLELKPRSARADRSRRRSTSAKGDPFASPFGDARPREEVLESRGVDIKAIDKRLEKKAAVLVFTKDQEIQIEAVRADLTKAEARFREANEKELPEETFRVQVEEKRNELNDLVAKFTELNSLGKTVQGWNKSSPSKASPREDSRRSHSPANKFVRGTGRMR